MGVFVLTAAALSLLLAWAGAARPPAMTMLATNAATSDFDC
jgi:hypothetical protein